MLLFNLLIFDQRVEGTAAVYTNPEANAPLGLAEKLVFQFVSERVQGTSPTLTITEETSGDGQFWIEKQTLLSALPLDENNTDSLRFTDTGQLPNMGLVRLRIQLDGTDPSATLRIYCAGRGEYPTAN